MWNIVWLHGVKECVSTGGGLADDDGYHRNRSNNELQEVSRGHSSLFVGGQMKG